MHAKPYVGITGITKHEEIMAIERIIARLNWPPSHAVMLGVLVSGWTLEGKAPSNPRQYPPTNQIDGLVSSHPGVINLVHYNNGRRPQALDLQIVELMRLAPGFDGVQLNFAWPNPVELRRGKLPGDVIVLQIGANAVREFGLDGSAGLLRAYGGITDYALVDLSGGTGKPLDMNASLAMVAAFDTVINEHSLGIRLGIAGGLCAERMPAMEPLVQAYPELSWDAQAGLRGADDRLDVGRVRAYLEASRRLILH